MTSISESQMGLCDLAGPAYCLVPGIDRMPPFLATVASPSDHWLYVSSNGGLAAGREKAERALFPYRTDDLLHRVHPFSGPWTGIRVDGTTWEPFTGRTNPTRSRDLARSVAGDRLAFREVNHTLQLECTSTWAFSDPHGFVRTTTLALAPDAAEPIEFDLLDGLRELVPSGAPLGAMQTMSCLINAYTRVDQVGDTRLATISMESALSDLAEPAESLSATVVWSVGLPEAVVTLGATAPDFMVRGEAVPTVTATRGEVAAYFIGGRYRLEPGESMTWSLVADVDRTAREIVDIRKALASPDALARELHHAIDESSREMDRLIAQTDGLQRSGDETLDAHHRMNTLFNDMRGGVFANGSRLPWGDWVDFLRDRNRACADRHQSWLESRDPDTWIDRSRLIDDTAERNDITLQRLALEYLPLWFGRRHGDPSRPWNAFNIRVRHADGSRRLTYEGNWRDIFQNWEALLLAHPAWCDHVIAKFLNASTPDGFNPYRITREGIDWEVPEPGNPWSNIGYWGDHQVSYLTRLLELSRSLDPARLGQWLDQPIFSHADVPYRLAPYDRLVEDPRRTITFDQAAHDAAMARVDAIGADGRLVHDAEGNIVHATLAEKLLIPVLAKLSSFVPDGGVWMNTQRPEWNDANNALAGYGLSMVTASQLRRHLALLGRIFAEHSGSLRIDAGVAHWLSAVTSALASNRDLLERPTIAPNDRRRVVDELGRGFETYRAQLDRPSDAVDVPRDDCLAACELGVAWLDHAIAANRRDDGLYHGYNLVQFTDDSAEVEHLPEMLEGQVAVLSSGTLSPAESVELLERLYESELHRDDLDTFLLYPARTLPPLWNKGIVPAEEVASNPLLKALEDANDNRIIESDVDEVVRFSARFRNARDLVRTLDELAGESTWAELVHAHRERTLEAYESAFHHHAFTGRSGGMYGYEGIGCTYWHMIGKLLVAAGECHASAVELGADDAVVQRLAAAYHRIRDGLGFRMSADRFGGVPIDAYSHTPADGGARQPGMTGQVKEELLTRRMELGVQLRSGALRFSPRLLTEEQWLKTPVTWHIPHREAIELPADALGFQLCGIPVVYRRTTTPPRIRVHTTDGVEEIPGDEIDGPLAQAIFAHDERILRIDVDVNDVG